jgi:hypothetical protein
MVDTQEPKAAGQTIDPAALAFEALREEVALARRAVAGLAAERASIEIPDYTESLGKIMQSSAATAKNLRVLTEVPILHATVQDWARAIEQANTTARQADRDALATLHRQLREVVDDIFTTLRMARTSDIQRQWLLWTFIGAMLAGILLGVFAIVPLVHAL